MNLCVNQAVLLDNPANSEGIKGVCPLCLDIQMGIADASTTAEWGGI